MNIYKKKKLSNKLKIVWKIANIMYKNIYICQNMYKFQNKRVCEVKINLFSKETFF